jgi:hypothetical protein
MADHFTITISKLGVEVSWQSHRYPPGSFLPTRIASSWKWTKRSGTKVTTSFPELLGMRGRKALGLVTTSDQSVLNLLLGTGPIMPVKVAFSPQRLGTPPKLDSGEFLEPSWIVDVLARLDGPRTK